MKEMSLCYFIGAAIGFSSFLGADTLPVLTEELWSGFWVGYEEREFDFGVSGKGAGELLLKERVRGGTERITDTRTVTVNYLVEEEKGGKWQRRTLQTDELESDFSASTEVKQGDFVANYTGGAKAKVHHRFEDDEVLISIEWLEKGGEDDARIRIEVEIPDLHRIQSGTDAREVKRKMRGIRF